MCVFLWDYELNGGIHFVGKSAEQFHHEFGGECEIQVQGRLSMWQALEGCIYFDTFQWWIISITIEFLFYRLSIKTMGSNFTLVRLIQKKRLLEPMNGKRGLFRELPIHDKSTTMVFWRTLSTLLGIPMTTLLQRKPEQVVTCKGMYSRRCKRN